MTETCKLVVTSLDNELTYDDLEETDDGIKIKELEHYCEDPILFFPLINKENAYILKTSSNDYNKLSHTYTVYHIQVLYNWIYTHGTDPFTRMEIDRSDIEKAYEKYKNNYFKEGIIYTIETEHGNQITLKGNHQEIGLPVTKLESESTTIKALFDADQKLLFKQTSKGLKLSKKIILSSKEKLHFHISLGHRNSESILFFQTKETQPHKNYYGLSYEPANKELFDSILKDKDTYIIRIIKNPFHIELYKSESPFTDISFALQEMPLQKIEPTEIKYLYNHQEKNKNELEELIGQTYTNILEKQVVIELTPIEEDLFTIDFIKLYLITPALNYGEEFKFINNKDLFKIEEENRDIMKGYKVDQPGVLYTFQKYYKLPNTYTLVKKEDS